MRRQGIASNERFGPRECLGVEREKVRRSEVWGLSTMIGGNSPKPSRTIVNLWPLPEKWATSMRKVASWAILETCIKTKANSSKPFSIIPRPWPLSEKSATNALPPPSWEISATCQIMGQYPEVIAHYTEALTISRKSATSTLKPAIWATLPTCISSGSARPCIAPTGIVDALRPRKWKQALEGLNLGNLGGACPVRTTR